MIRDHIFTVEPMAEVDEPALLRAERIKLAPRSFLFTDRAGIGFRILCHGHGIEKISTTHFLKYSDPFPAARQYPFGA